MDAVRPRYLAYMLRLWEVEDDEGPVWRVSLESPHTGERQVFNSLEALMAFLRAETVGFFPPAPPDLWTLSDASGGPEPRAS